MAVKVIQWWDDGVVDDVRLTDMLRRCGATATFSLNPGLYGEARTFGWHHDGKEIWRLALHELTTVYEGFDIASHSLTHLILTDVPPDVLYREVNESRTWLEDLFRRPVGGFCYPFDAWNDAVRHAVRAAGYRFARGNALGRAYFPPADPFTFHPQCHFLSNHFWTLYEEARRDDAVFFFWGHSYELVDEMMWLTLEGMYERISSDLDATWVSIPSLFAV